MTLDQRIHLTSLVDNQCFSFVLNYCKEKSLTPSEALNVIIREWAGNKEIEPIKTSLNFSDLALLETKLKNCQKTIEELRKELKLAKL